MDNARPIGEELLHRLNVLTVIVVSLTLLLLGGGVLIFVTSRSDRDDLRDVVVANTRVNCALKADVEQRLLLTGTRITGATKDSALRELLRANLDSEQTLAGKLAKVRC